MFLDFTKAPGTRSTNTCRRQHLWYCMIMVDYSHLDSVDDDSSTRQTRSGVEAYYALLESRLGYSLFLGGARHLGYFDKDTWWPFPFSDALRRMEDKMLEGLGLPAGSRVLDAGCGTAVVSCHLAQRGDFNVVGIDLVEPHIQQAALRVARAERRGILHPQQVTLQRLDYQQLFPCLDRGSFDGVCAMESIAHANGPKRVFEMFFDVLRPGGRICFHDIEHIPFIEAAHVGSLARRERLGHSWQVVNEIVSLPGWESALVGRYKRLLNEVGFIDVTVDDLTANLWPMLRFFYLLGIFPYYVLRLFGYERCFINAVFAVVLYRTLGSFYFYRRWTATKPEAR